MVQGRHLNELNASGEGEGMGDGLSKCKQIGQQEEEATPEEEQQQGETACGKQGMLKAKQNT